MLENLGDMMGKLKEAQAKIEKAKKRLNNIKVEESGAEGQLKVVSTANREITEISISPGLLEDREALEDYLVVTINKALHKAAGIQEKEMSAVAKEGMPNIPGMDSLLK